MRVRFDRSGCVGHRLRSLGTSTIEYAAVRDRTFPDDLADAVGE